MPQELPYEIYERHGISFYYPDDWELDESANEESINISLESPLTVTLTISLFPSRPQPVFLIEQVMDLFQSEYEELDIYELQEIRAGHSQAFSQEAEFVCHELINQLKCNALRTGSFSILIISQGYDEDMHQYKQVLEKMIDTLSLDAEDDKIIV